MSMIVRNTSNRWLPVMVTNTIGNLIPRHIEPFGTVTVSSEDAAKIQAVYGGQVEIVNAPVVVLPATGTRL